MPDDLRPTRWWFARLVLLALAVLGHGVLLVLRRLEQGRRR